MAGHEMDPDRNAIDARSAEKAQPGACAGLRENATDIPEKFNAWH